MATKKKKIIIIIVLGTLIVGVFLAIKFRTTMQKNSKTQTTFTVKKETFSNIIEVSGIIAAAQSQTLKVAGAGTIENVFVKEGDIVKKGQKMIQLNDFEQKYNLERLDYEIAQKKINGAKKELSLLAAQREMLVDQLKNRQVVAMFDGIVAQLSIATGDYLEAKDTVGTIINREYLTATVEVAESDVLRLALDQSVSLIFPAYKGKTVNGKVISWPSVARITSSGATVVDARIRVENPPAEILPNYSFTGKIEISEPQSVLIVENQAVGSDEKGSFVIRVDNAQGTGQDNEKIYVSVDAYERNFVKINDTLKEGDVLKSLKVAELGMNFSEGAAPQRGQQRGAR